MPPSCTGFSAARPFVRASARMPWSCVDARVVPVGLPSSPSTGASIGRISRVEAALVARLARRASASASAKRVDVLARDAALLRDALGRRELVERRSPTASPAVWKKPGPLITFAPRPTWLITSTPHAMPHVDAARLDERADEVVGLLARAALRVDRRAGDACSCLPRAEPGVARDVVRLLARLRDAAADDLLDLGRIDAGALDDRAPAPSPSSWPRGTPDSAPFAHLARARSASAAPRR